MPGTHTRSSKSALRFGSKSPRAQTAGGGGTKAAERQPHRWFRGWFSNQAWSRRNLADFTRQFALLVRAGLPVLRGLEILARSSPAGGSRSVIEELAATIRTGGSLSQGLASHPRVFDRLYVAMVTAGEAGSALPVVLGRLATFIEQGHRLRGRIVAALTYPAIVTGVAAGIVGLMMVFVVPKFQDIFSSLLKGQPLPGLTQALIDFSAAVMEHATIGIAILIGLVAAWGPLWRTGPAQQLQDRWVLRVPLLGDLALKVVVARFARTLGTLLGSGVPLLSALQIARDTSGNHRVADALQLVHDQVKAGGSIAAALEARAFFPGMVGSMIEVGEETGALPDMLGRIADIYDEEVEYAIARLTTMLEPILIILMALAVGTIVIALFLPLVGIVQQL